MQKKYLAIIVIILSILLVLCSCGEEQSSEEPGEITTPQEEEEEEKEEGHSSIFDFELPSIPEGSVKESPFTKLPNTLGYEMKRVKIPSASLSFEIPQDWTFEAPSHRYIKLKSSVNDPKLPALSVLMTFAYDVDMSNTDDRSYEPAGYLNRYFDFETDFYGYELTDGTYYPEVIPVADEIYNDPDFTGDNKDIVSIQVRHDVIYMSKGTRIIYSVDDPILMTTYINWYGLPLCVSALYPGACKADMDALIRYIISSFEYEEIVLDSLSEYTYDRFTFTLPSDFTDPGYSALMPPEDKLSAIDGIHISISQYDPEGLELTASNATDIFSSVLHRNLPLIDLRDYMLMPASYDTEGDYFIAGNPVDVFDGTCSYRAQKYRDEYVQTEIGVTGILSYRLYLYHGDEGKDFAITVTYPLKQYKTVLKIFEMIENNTIVS